MNEFKLPEHLKKIERIFVDSSMMNSPLALRVASRLPELPLEPVETDDGGLPEVMKNLEGDAQYLYLKEYKGKFLRFCPGTRYYHCCGYQIIHIGENCPLACSYCILQAYFQDRIMKVWANQNDLFDELGKSFSAEPGKRFRVGTGEYTDSLALESLTGYSNDLTTFLESYPNVCLELKSKIIDLSWMENLTRTDRVLPAWSLNAPYIHDHEEFGTSSLEERLSAARQCAENGFRVCLHFDPIIRFDGWREGYSRIVDMIFDYLKPEDIAYMSLGSFRHMPHLKQVIENNFPETTYIYDEFIVGKDNKMRLLRPLRVRQFKFIVDRLRKYGMDKQLYFCMESSENWKDVFGYTPADLGGLNNHLMKQAFGDKS
jgi:spore photoproduct lyase